MPRFNPITVALLVHFSNAVEDEGDFLPIKETTTENQITPAKQRFMLEALGWQFTLQSASAHERHYSATTKDGDSIYADEQIYQRWMADWQKTHDDLDSLS